MEDNAYFTRLVENALDFLQVAYEELESKPKYSVIHFYAAVELFLKARLMAEHWTLVVSKRHDPDWNQFSTGDFVSVTLDEAALRLQKVVRSPLSKEELRTFKRLGTHRNKAVHFFHAAHSAEENATMLQAIAKEHLSAWYFLYRLLRGKWRDTFGEWEEQLEELNRRLRAHHTFLQVIFEHLGAELEKKKEEGRNISECPSCGFEAQESEDEVQDEVYTATCHVCATHQRFLTVDCPECGTATTFENEGFGICLKCETRFEPEQLVEILFNEDEAYVATKDGDPSWELGNCSECDGYHTLVRRDQETWLCAGCLGVFEDVAWCQWCNEPNSGDMDFSYISGCNVCDGKGGYD